MFVEFLILLSVLVYILYRWSISTFNTFTERGIPHQKPLPLIGNALPFLRNDISFHKLMVDLYKESKQHKIYGFYNFRLPFFIVNDIELIKQIGVKDFEVFANHQRILNLDKDPLFGNMLSSMKDQRWRNMRNMVTPLFTGSKMRAMFTLMNDCFAESVKYLNRQPKIGDNFDIELKDLFGRLSNDLIATTAFGVKVNSFVTKDNEFYTIGQDITGTVSKFSMKLLACIAAPELCDLLGITIFDQRKMNYFMYLVLDTIKYREKHNIIRPDMIQLLMEARKESAYQWTDEEIVAQCFTFFFAAFKNNANLLCFSCHELAVNPLVQEKVYEEILEIRKKLNGKTLDYETLKDMKYLDMVVAETLRKWPLLALNDRECSRDYTLKDENNQIVCELKKGDRIWLQTIGLHWDEQFYENPAKFDPERFNDENKHNITPFNYKPWGVGPRICTGIRHAQMQAKAMIYYLLLDFSLEPTEKTSKNLLEDMRGFQAATKSGFWVKLRKRTQSTDL